MMKDPAFQARMKTVTENEDFKQNMEKTQEMLKDEDKVKEMEESMKKRVEEGSKELEEFKKKSAELEEEERIRSGELKVSYKLVLMWLIYRSIHALTYLRFSAIPFLAQE